METSLREYFQSWIDKKPAVLDDIFEDNIVYIECYGPEYHGISQIREWFKNWNEKGTVLRWEIKRTFQQGKTLIAEWYFKYEFEGKKGDFDGVSVVDFSENGRISRLCEYKSEHQHFYPFE